MELDGFKDLEQQRQAREDFFEKSFDPTYIEKGKRGGTGEIREWKDGKYQKQSDGTWKPVKEGGGKSIEFVLSKGDKFVHPKYGELVFSHKVEGTKKGDADYYFSKVGKEQGLSKVKLGAGEVGKLKKENSEKKEDPSSLVGKKFNHEGLTYQVTKQGATQSEAEAVTESLKGKKITIGNKVVEKQAGGSKEDSELKKGTIVTFKTDSGIPAAGVMHSEDIIRTTTGNLLNVSYTKDLKVADDSKAEKVKSQMRSRKYADGKSYFDEYEDKE